MPSKTEDTLLEQHRERVERFFSDDPTVGKTEAEASFRFVMGECYRCANPRSEGHITCPEHRKDNVVHQIRRYAKVFLQEFEDAVDNGFDADARELEDVREILLCAKNRVRELRDA